MGMERNTHMLQQCPNHNHHNHYNHCNHYNYRHISACLRHLLCAFMLAADRAANETGAARRRQRRLRHLFRHERLSVAMALAELQHHTAPRGERMAGGREEEGTS